MADPISGGLMVAGTIMSASAQQEAGRASERQGRMEKAYADYKAKQIRRNAGQVKATAQRTQEDTALQAELVKSRAQAMMAAEGSSSDPGSMRIIAGIESEGAYRESIAIYEGESEAQAMEEQAKGLEIGGMIALEGGKAAKKASGIGAVGTILSGGGSIYGKYGKTA